MLRRFLDAAWLVAEVAGLLLFLFAAFILAHGLGF